MQNMRYSLVESLLGFWGGRSVDARIVAALLKSRVAGIAIFDHQLRCVQVNAEMTRLAATTPDRFVGRTLGDIMGDSRTDELSAIAHVLSTGTPVHDRTIESGDNRCDDYAGYH